MGDFAYSPLGGSVFASPPRERFCCCVTRIGRSYRLGYFGAESQAAGPAIKRHVCRYKNLRPGTKNIKIFTVPPTLFYRMCVIITSQSCTSLTHVIPRQPPEIRKLSVSPRTPQRLSSLAGPYFIVCLPRHIVDLEVFEINQPPSDTRE